MAAQAVADTASSAEATVAAAEKARDVAAQAAKDALAASGLAGNDLEAANTDLAAAEEFMAKARAAYQEGSESRRDEA